MVSINLEKLVLYLTLNPYTKEYKYIYTKKETMKKNNSKSEKKLEESLKKEWSDFFNSNHISVSDDIIEEIVLKAINNVEEIPDEIEEDDVEEDEDDESKERIIN